MAAAGSVSVNLVAGAATALSEVGLATLHIAAGDALCQRGGAIFAAQQQQESQEDCESEVHDAACPRVRAATLPRCARRRASPSHAKNSASASSSSHVKAATHMISPASC